MQAFICTYKAQVLGLQHLDKSSSASKNKGSHTSRVDAALFPEVTELLTTQPTLPQLRGSQLQVCRDPLLFQV